MIGPDEAREMLKEALHKEKDRKAIGRLTRPVMRQMPSLYKTKKAKGWGVVADALISDDSATAAGK